MPVVAVVAAAGRLGVELDVAALVAGSDEQRYALSDDGALVRADQGHPVPVELGLRPVTPPPVLFHGTSQAALAAIRRDGFLPMRHAVHLSGDVATARAVGSRRRGAVVVLAVDAAAMHAAGSRFTRSANGVWLTAAAPPGSLAVHELLPAPDRVPARRGGG